VLGRWEARDCRTESGAKGETDTPETLQLSNARRLTVQEIATESTHVGKRRVTFFAVSNGWAHIRKMAEAEKRYQALGLL